MVALGVGGVFVAVAYAIYRRGVLAERQRWINSQHRWDHYINILDDTAVADERERTRALYADVLPNQNVIIG